MTAKVALVLGIRPDIIRASLIIGLLDESPDIDLTFIWSGQHYSDNLKDVFFRELNVRKPDIELGCSGETDAEVSSKIIERLYNALDEIKPDAVMFLGDTNTNAGALAATQHNIPLIHIEGCMRSYDWRMPEEKYRTFTDHLSDIIYAYLDAYKKKGLDEGIKDERIVVVGNPIVDVLNKYYNDEMKAGAGETLKKYDVSKGEYCLMTCHRRENVEEKDPLRRIVKLLSKVDKTIVFAASYRTQKSLKKFGIELPSNVNLVDPIGYMDFLHLMGNASYILTDSGTVVEEACVLKVPTIQMRYTTERPETYDVGASIRFDPTIDYDDSEYEKVISGVNSIIGGNWDNPFGDGKSSRRIADDIINRAKSGAGFDTHDRKKTTM